MSMMEQVTPNVFTTTSLRGCNPSFVVTSAGVVQIDTPQLPTKAVAMRAAAEQHGPIGYLINTEHHRYHIFGNHWSRGAGGVGNQRAASEAFTGPGSVRLCPRGDPERRAGRRCAPPRPRRLLRRAAARDGRVHRRSRVACR